MAALLVTDWQAPQLQGPCPVAQATAACASTIPHPNWLSRAGFPRFSAVRRRMSFTSSDSSVGSASSTSAATPDTYGADAEVPLKES